MKKHVTVGRTAGAAYLAQAPRKYVKVIQKLWEDCQQPTMPLVRWLINEGNAYSGAERLFFLLEPRQEGDREAAAAFWEQQGESHDDFVLGWVEGVVKPPETTLATGRMDRQPEFDGRQRTYMRGYVEGMLGRLLNLIAGDPEKHNSDYLAGLADGDRYLTKGRRDFTNRFSNEGSKPKRRRAG